MSGYVRQELTCGPDSGGCFGSDPGALDALNFDDSCVRTGNKEVALAAVEAGMGGAPLESTTYRPVTVNVNGSGLNFGEPQTIGSLADRSDELSQVRHRIASAAYACGKVISSGGCPVFKLATAKQETQIPGWDYE